MNFDFKIGSSHEATDLNTLGESLKDKLEEIYKILQKLFVSLGFGLILFLFLLFILSCFYFY